MKQIIIVEGKSDTRRLKEIYPDVVTFQTSGLGLDEEKIEELKHLEASGVELVCFTDPDYPGEKIREKLTENLTNLKHAYVAREHSIAKNGKIGIESATTDEIKKALGDLKVSNSEQQLFTNDFLMAFGIVGNKVKREMLCDALGIANGNNKKLLKQLNSFGFEPKVVIQTIEEINAKIEGE